MGVCWLPRTVCESVGERWCEGAGSSLTLAWVSRTLFVAWCKCTVGQRVAVWSTRDVAIETGAHLSTDSGQHVPLADPGYPVTPMLARMLARAVDGTDFRPPTKR